MRVLASLLVVVIFCGLSCATEDDPRLKELVSDLKRRLLHRKFRGYDREEEVGQQSDDRRSFQSFKFHGSGRSGLEQKRNFNRREPWFGPMQHFKLHGSDDQLNNANYRRVFEKRKKVECDTPLEIAFVLDESGSIWNPHFIDQLNFVNDVIDVFTVDEDSTHIAVMTFASNTEVFVKLGQYVEDVEKMQDVISNIIQKRGQTRTDLALKVLRENLMNPSETRPGIPHIAIIITDGASDEHEETLKEAEFAKEDGITIFAIGVGNYINLDELRAIATSDKYVFEVKSYDELLEKLIDDLPDAACQVTTLPPPTTTTITTTTPTTTTTRPPQMMEGCDGSNPLDVLFAAPDEAGIMDTEIALGFIQEVVKGFNISSRHVQVGMTPRFCGDLEGIALNKNDIKATLLNDIQNRNLQSTLLYQQLDHLLYEGFMPEAGDRKSAKDVAILLVDNQATRPDIVMELAADAKAEGISLIVIGIGDYVDKGLLANVASSEKHLFLVEEYRELFGLTEKIHDVLCLEASR